MLDLVRLCREVDTRIAEYVSMRCVNRCLTRAGNGKSRAYKLLTSKYRQAASEPCEYCRDTAAQIRMDERVRTLLALIEETNDD